MKSQFEPKNQNFEQEVRASFERQAFMGFLGARLETVAPGFCEISLTFRDELSQQHGFFHGGIIGTLADNAGGYAAYSLMASTDSVLTVEYKLNIIAPGEGEQLIARGKVIKAGRTLSICQTEVFSLRDGNEYLCATSLQTLMCMQDRSDKSQ